MQKGYFGLARFGAAACLLTLSATTANAICVPLTISNLNSGGEYVSHFLDVLVILRTAVHRSVEFGQTQNAVDGIASFESAKREYECVDSLMEPYGASTNTSISASAMSLRAAVVSFLSISEEARQQFKDLLDGKPVKPSEQASQGGKMEVDAKDAWHLENNAVVAACFSLVEFGPDKKQSLAISQTERTALLAKISEKFGNPSSKATVSPIQSSAIIIRDFLAERKGRSTGISP